MSEKCDRSFMRRVFDCPVSTPIESYYLETSTLPVRFIIMGRRLMYLWSILHKSDNELVKKVYNTQKEFPVKNDWVLQVQDDLSKCKIELSDEEIASMNKEKFRKIVNSAIKELSEEYLSNLVEKHSKTEKLVPSDKMQNYLTNDDTTVNEKKLLFSLRSRMYPVKMNYRNGHSNLLCSLCSKEEENQQHLLVCEKIVEEEKLRNVIMKNKIYYEDIFGSPKKQTEAVKIWKIIDEIWKRKLKATLDPSLSGSQDAPLSASLQICNFVMTLD